MSSVRWAPWSPDQAFFVKVGLVLPLLLAGLAVLLRSSGLDDRISAYFYDAQTQQFWLDTNGWAELLGHRLGKSLVLVVWLLLLAAAAAAPWLSPLKTHRRLLWTLVLAMGLGPSVVTLLKDINTHACPWSLKEFGGAANYSAEWFVPRLEAGRCFPGGHASGGFSLVAIAFAGQSLQRPRLRRLGLWLGLGVGALFSLLRVAQGAHFMSHNLWAASVDLWLAALVFSPLLLAPSHRPKLTASMGAPRSAS
ncbi:phosphatase PAP2 family protein [Variovorax sp. HJSM1_2]|uniref:phosphatase PAP2 family protein n=1 Tax=Variovorax sp. HJSM1_2 TaxID=3366263 RepID=UPI003BE45773